MENGTVLEEQRQRSLAGEIIRGIKSLLESSDTPDVNSLARDLSTENREGPIKIAFAGEYSSGKSTIIKALTGDPDIETGETITTGEANDYDWNGILITDTPGIHTGIRPEHDKRAQAAILESDLLAYVVTNELFNGEIGRNFRDLTVRMNKGHETILIVNKMDRHAWGNTLEAAGIVEQAVAEVTSPYTAKALRLTCIAAESYLKGLEPAPPERQEHYREESNMESLVRNLDGFIRGKGLTARNAGPLRRAVDAAERGMAAVPTGDQDMDNAAILYQRITQTIRENADRTRREAEQAAEETEARIEEEGSRFSLAILPGATEEEIKRKEKESADCVQQECESLAKRLDEVLLAGIGRTAQDLESLNGDLIFRNIQDRIGRNKDWRSAAKAVKTVSELTKKLSQGTRMTSGVARASGSVMHTGVLRVGHFFGRSFRPWEAVKIARGIGTAAAILSAAMVVLDIVLTMREQKKQDEAIANLDDLRAETANQFSTEARRVKETAMEAVEEALQESLWEAAREADDEIVRLNFERASRNALVAGLQDARARGLELVALMHGAAPVAAVT